MNLTVPKTELSKALSIVIKAVSTKSPLPILSSVLLCAKEGQLVLSTTNLEIGITKTIKADVKEEGECTLPAKTFSELVSSLAEEEVKLKFDSTDFSVTITSGKSKSKLKGIDAQEFPPITVMTVGNTFSLPVTIFKDMIVQTSFCASDDDARPTLQNVQLVGEQDALSLNATDGYSIAHTTHNNIDYDLQRINSLISAKSLDTLSKILAGYKNDETVNIAILDNKAIFQIETLVFTAQLSEGEFPNWKVILPTAFETSVTMPLENLVTACKQASIIAKEGNNAVVLNIKQDKVTVSSISEEVGNSENIMDGVLIGNELEVAFNVDFLSAILARIDGESVVLELNTNKSPCRISEKMAVKGTFYILMPLTLG